MQLLVMLLHSKKVIGLNLPVGWSKDVQVDDGDFKLAIGVNVSRKDR